MISWKDHDVAERIVLYERGEISREEFFKDLKFTNETHRICFCTGKSLDAIERIDLKPLSRMEKIGIFVVDDLMTKDDLLREDALYAFFSSKLFTKLKDENTKLYDKPASEIYNMLKKEMEKNQENQKDNDDGLSLI